MKGGGGQQVPPPPLNETLLVVVTWFCGGISCFNIVDWTHPLQKDFSFYIGGCVYRMILYTPSHMMNSLILLAEKGKGDQSYSDPILY